MNQPTPLARILRILTLLSPLAPVSLEMMARELGVSRWTVRKDLATLSRVPEVDLYTLVDGRFAIGSVGYRRLLSLFRRVGELGR